MRWYSIEDIENKIVENNKKINQSKKENSGCGCSLFFILAAVFLSFVEGGFFYSILGWLLLIIFAVLFISFMQLNAAHKKTVEELDNENEELKKRRIEVEEEIEEKKEKEQLKKDLKRRIVFSDEVKVAGISYRKNAVNKTIKYIVDNSMFDVFYEDMTNKEIEEYGDRIYKYSLMTTEDVDLIKEPDNEFDNKAIKVVVNGEMIGYIESETNKTIYNYIDNPEYSIKKQLSIVGGPYKEFNYLEDKVIVNKELSIGFRIVLIITKNT